MQQLLTLIDAHNEPVAPAVAEAAARGLAGTSVGTHVGVRTVHEGTDATVAELVLSKEDGSVQQWVLKIHRDHPTASSPATHRAGHEAEALAALSDGVGIADPREGESPRHLGVPRLIGDSSTEGWLVMESCPGRSLAQLIRFSRGSVNVDHWQATLTALRHTGDWLRCLHQRELDVEPGVAMSAWHAAVAADLDRCRSVVPMSELFEVQEQLSRALDRSDDAGLPVLHHGDFGPGNIFVSEDRIQVIDFEAWRPGLPYEDVAYFAIQLELFFEYPFLRARGQQAVSAFLEGYLRGDPLDPLAYFLARKSKAVQILAHTTPQSAAAHRRRHAALRRILKDQAA